MSTIPEAADTQLITFLWWIITDWESSTHGVRRRGQIDYSGLDFRHHINTVAYSLRTDSAVLKTLCIKWQIP